MQSPENHIHSTGLVLLGAALGASLAALFVPRSGVDTRRRIRYKLHEHHTAAQDSLESVIQEAKEIRQKLEEARDNNMAPPDRLAKRDSLEEGLGE